MKRHDRLLPGRISLGAIRRSAMHHAFRGSLSSGTWNKCGNFRKILDSSVTILLDKNIRITEIKKALRESDKPIEIMAEENGFISMQTMTRNFIEELGISPVKF